MRKLPMRITLLALTAVVLYAVTVHLAHATSTLHRYDVIRWKAHHKLHNLITTARPYSHYTVKAIRWQRNRYTTYTRLFN